MSGASSVYALARACGLPWRSMLLVLDRHRVPYERQTSVSRARVRIVVLDPAAAKAAVAAETRTETLTDACARLHIGPGQLGRLVRAAGIPSRRGSRLHLTPEQWDRLTLAWRAARSPSGLWTRRCAQARHRAAFWARVDRTAGEAGCWPWQGPRCRTEGVGLLPKPRHKKGEIVPTAHVHRIAWLILRGELPTRLYNTCGTWHCCNPAHWSTTRGRFRYRPRAFT